MHAFVVAMGGVAEAHRRRVRSSLACLHRRCESFEWFGESHASLCTDIFSRILRAMSAPRHGRQHKARASDMRDVVGERDLWLDRRSCLAQRLAGASVGGISCSAQHGGGLWRRSFPRLRSVELAFGAPPPPSTPGGQAGRDVFRSRAEPGAGAACCEQHARGCWHPGAGKQARGS